MGNLPKNDSNYFRWRQKFIQDYTEWLVWDHFFSGSSKKHPQHFAMGMRKEIWKGAAEIWDVSSPTLSLIQPNVVHIYIQHKNSHSACIQKIYLWRTVFFLEGFKKLMKKTCSNQWVVVFVLFFAGWDVPKVIFAFHQWNPFQLALMVCCWEVQFQLPVAVGRCQKELPKVEWKICRLIHYKISIKNVLQSLTVGMREEFQSHFLETKRPHIWYIYIDIYCMFIWTSFISIKNTFYMSQVSLHVHLLEWWLYHSCEGWTEDSTETFAELCRGISHICRMGWEEPDRLGGWQDVIWFHLASSLLKPKIRDGCEQWWLFIWSFLPRTANIICIYKKYIYI